MLPRSEEKNYITSVYTRDETKKFDIYEFNQKEAEEFLQFLDEAKEPIDVEWLMLEMVGEQAQSSRHQRCCSKTNITDIYYIIWISIQHTFKRWIHFIIFQIQVNLAVFHDTFWRKRDDSE